MSSAQTTIGFKAGLFWTTTNSPTVKYENTRVSFYPSYSLGLEINKHASKRFSIGTRASYDHYRFDYYFTWYGAYGPPSGSLDYSIHTGYLDFYLYPQFNFGNKVVFYFNFGPAIGFYLHSTAKGFYRIRYSNKPGEEGYYEGDASEELNEVKVAFMTSTGLKINLKDKWSLVTEMNLRIGSDIFTSTTITNQLEIRASVGIHYRINDKGLDLKKK
jgi:hypothetical protein